MPLKITKRENKAVTFDYGNRYRNFSLVSLTGVKVSISSNGPHDTQDKILIEYAGGYVLVDFNTLEEVNGEPRPETIEGTADKILLEVFNLGGGNGTGVADEDFRITQQPVNRSLSSPDGTVGLKPYLLLFIDFNKIDAVVQWVGSIDGGQTFPFGPYKSNGRIWVYDAAFEKGTYRAEVTFNGVVYYSDTVEITL